MDREQLSEIDAQTEEVKPRLRRPPKYRVWMLNDDFTPMDFVIHILKYFFAMDEERATRVMLQVHTQGRAECGIFSRDIADTKARQVNLFAQQNHHPLKCTVEKVE